eukprot:COSAG01_NODE_3817_length_5669_cov_3.770916_4_plen_76_part_00
MTRQKVYKLVTDLPHLVDIVDTHTGLVSVPVVGGNSMTAQIGSPVAAHTHTRSLLPVVVVVGIKLHRLRGTLSNT